MPAASIVTATIRTPVQSERDLLRQILRGFGVVSPGADAAAIPVAELLQMLERFLAGLPAIGAVAEVRIRGAAADTAAIVERLKALKLAGDPLVSLESPTSIPIRDGPRQIPLATGLAIAAGAAVVAIAVSALIYTWSAR